MTLREEIKPLTGNKRKFLLLRVAGIFKSQALDMCGIKEGTYNSWLHSDTFTAIYSRVGELSLDYRQEAIRMLRRDNQLEAVLLEGQIIKKMKDELEAGEYSLVRTNLAREVYSKLITDLDAVPSTTVFSWEQRIEQVLSRNPERLGEGGEVIEGEFHETGNQSEEQPPASQLVTQGEQQSTEETETQGE